MSPKPFKPDDYWTDLRYGMAAFGLLAFALFVIVMVTGGPR